MLSLLEGKIKKLIAESLSVSGQALENLSLSAAPSHVNADFALAWPISSAKILKKPPMETAEKIARLISQKEIAQAAAAKPGFVNLKLSDSFLINCLEKMLKDKEYFKFKKYSGSVNIEFVSANPTGPLHLASGRASSIGGSLIKIFGFTGHDARAEYYVNDSGRQVELLGQSLKARFSGEEIPENGYKGEYLKNMAKELPPEAVSWKPEEFARYAVKAMVKTHREDLKKFGVEFDTWFLESELHQKKLTEKCLADLRQKNLVYEKDKALWFGAAGDDGDKDRVLVKSDGKNTYFLNDIAYHLNKFDRGFDHLIDIWGADHHGYVARMKSAVDALAKGRSFTVILHQLVILKIGDKLVKMSKREGEFISLKELVKDVGKDACRFFFAMRGPNTHLTFDMALAKKKSNENPVYYVQYVHARICSIFSKAEEKGLDKIPFPKNFSLNAEEKRLAGKLIWFEKVLAMCIDDLSPHHLTVYLIELAGLFHSFYDKHKVLDENNPGKTALRLKLLGGIKFIISNGLELLGVSSPEKM